MSNEGGDGVWFRRSRRPGVGYSAAAWQGVAVILVFVAALLMTVFAADPDTARPANAPAFLKMKVALGLGGAHLPGRVLLPLVLGEAGVFLLIVWWKGRRLKPLD